MELKLERIDMQVRDLLPMTKNRKNLPPIFFVTPTARRPTQKADLTRLHETLVRVPNLVWIVVEDAEEPSEFIDDILAETKMNAAHLTALTPEKVRMNETDPHWKLPRGVNQRNTALNWIRTNYRNQPKGVVYFGDDDNTYHWKLFEEMRTIHKIGVWPVGIVGGLLVETPLLHPNCKHTNSWI
jgi:galactosylgalactosylxylosylprotein 3-beta-glucuronosyltransferase 3